MSVSEKLDVRPITNPPGFHWFGYYDKFQFDPSDRYALAMQVDFEHRLYTGEDVIKIGMIDLADNDRWIALGESRAWSWQQGCMLQWRPGSDCEVVWNDCDGGRFVCRVLDVKTRHMRTLPRAVGTISPCGRFALGEDFSRIWSFRPGYAYAGIPDPYAEQTAPAETGVWQINMDTGETKQIVSLADLVKIPYPKQTRNDSHYVNHLAMNPTGERFLMFNRWSGAGQPTRVFTAAPDGSDLRLLSAHGASHWTWRDAEHVLIWAEEAYRLYRDDGSGEPVETVWEHPNGHQTFVPNTNDEWLLTDTYPFGTPPKQDLCLYHIPSRRKIVLASLDSPESYRGEWRCDLHPRLSRDATKVVVDSPHAGNGRQMYILDIEDIVRR
ncbi:MAG: hypothetical protein JW808_01360 [Victivallales bacterium]|nr:hypothetical protein [Victivallales bacterium]